MDRGQPVDDDDDDDDTIAEEEDSAITEESCFALVGECVTYD